jgi:aurora kinase
VLTYEFAAGFAPFSDCYDRKDMVRKIRELEFEYPEHFSEEIKHFIRSLLRTKPEDRMSLEKAEKHPWIVKNYLETLQKRLAEKERKKLDNTQEDVEI